jgi:vacuolar-type H+-ATPase catalytic subunit A/Vma1
MSNQSNETSQPIATPAQFIDEFEDFQQDYEHQWHRMNHRKRIDRDTALDLVRRARRLQQAGAVLLKDGTQHKETILRDLAFCHADAQAWANLFAAPAHSLTA